MPVQQLLGDLAETVAACSAGDFFQASLEAWILAVGEQLSGGLATVPRLSQGQLGMCVAPIQPLMVPNGCSAVERRTVIFSGW
jgi:hypothetical protein